MASLRNICWWILFLAAGIILERAVPRLDILLVGILITLEEKDYKTLVWLLPLVVLLQEGMGTLHFGASMLFYAAFFLCYWLFSALYSASKFFFIATLSTGLGAARFFIWRFFAALQGYPADPAETLHIAVLQTLYLPLAWIIFSYLRRPLRHHENRTEEE